MASALPLSLPDGFQELLVAQLLSADQGHLEVAIIEAYRERLISRGKLDELLGLSFQSREELLAARNVPYHYRPEELEADARTLDRVLGPFHP